jgi:hypothetical protein
MGWRAWLSAHANCFLGQNEWWRDMAPRVGDEVIVSCESASARVVAKDLRYITLEWPWGVVDNSSKFRWDGKMHLPVDDSTAEWTPFLMEPEPAQLRVGDVCTISIPPMRLHVGHYEEYDPPRNLGWAPAPVAGIYVMPPESAEIEDSGCMLYLGGAEPIRVQPVDGS